jgi:hypothetical protein
MNMSIRISIGRITITITIVELGLQAALDLCRQLLGRAWEEGIKRVESGWDMQE